MIEPGSQVLLTYYSRGRLALRGQNSSPKKDIHKMMKFAGAINPETGKFEKVLNVDWYLNNKRPFPKNYWWSKDKYQEPIYHQDVTRKVHWTWDVQVAFMLETPVGMNEKQWKKLSDKEKLYRHAIAGMLPGEDNVELDIFM